MEIVLSDEDIPEDCFIQHTEEGIDIICSNIGLTGTEVQLVNAMSRGFVLKQIINRVKDQYDSNLIDWYPFQYDGCPCKYISFSVRMKEAVREDRVF